MDDDPARRAAAVDDVEGIGGVFQPVDRRHVRAQLAVLEQREQRREVGGVERGFAPDA